MRILLTDYEYLFNILQINTNKIGIVNLHNALITGTWSLASVDRNINMIFGYFLKIFKI